MVTELKLYPRVFRYKGVTDIVGYLGIVRDKRGLPKRGIGSSETSRKSGRIEPESPLDIEDIRSRNRKVFIVHGHDEKIKGSVARFVEHCGLEPVILHEQPSKGFTTPEKLEAHDDVGFAVVLLTPDDEGRSKNDELLQSRARQNVLIELGYFWGKLTRRRTHAIYVKGVEIPTDWENVIYTLFDEAGAWKQALFKELKEVWPDVRFPS
ncbi:MAG: nucleotide-binding protein [candidate division Zixibacteria bacterium]|nr:nucleotide-binding protein [candidate division Zixibacteria bacterium]